MGGHQALMWATRFPKRVRGVIALATSPRLTSQALAFDVVGRNAIRRDPHYHGGQYYEEKHGPEVGLAIARMIGHITYLSREAMKQKFGDNRLQSREVATEFEKTFSVGSYLGHQGTKLSSASMQTVISRSRRRWICSTSAARPRNWPIPSATPKAAGW